MWSETRCRKQNEAQIVFRGPDRSCFSNQRERLAPGWQVVARRQPCEKTFVRRERDSVFRSIWAISRKRRVEGEIWRNSHQCVCCSVWGKQRHEWECRMRNVEDVERR